MFSLVFRRKARELRPCRLLSVCSITDSSIRLSGRSWCWCEMSVIERLQRHPTEYRAPAGEVSFCPESSFAFLIGFAGLTDNRGSKRTCPRHAWPTEPESLKAAHGSTVVCRWWEGPTSQQLQTTALERLGLWRIGQSFLTDSLIWSVRLEQPHQLAAPPTTATPPGGGYASH